MNEKYKRLIGNTVIFAIGNLSASLIKFLLVGLYTNVLTPEESGIISIITQTIQIADPLLTLGILEAVVRFALDGKDNRDQILTFALRILFMASIAASLITPLLTIWQPMYRPYLVYSVLSFAVLSLRAILAHFVRGIERVKVFAANGILLSFLTAIFNYIFLVVFPMGVQGHFLATIVSTGICCLHLFFAARLHQYIRLRLPKSDLPSQMLRYCIPLIPNTLSWLALKSATQFILTMSHGYEIAGMYSQASNIAYIVPTVTNIFQQAWQISSIQEYNNPDRNEFYSGVFRNLLHVAMPVGSGILLATPLIAHFLLNNEYYQAWTYIPLLIISAIFSAFSGFFGTVYSATKQSHRSMITTVIGAAVCIGSCLLLIPRFGAYAAAGSTMIGNAVMCIIRAIDTRRYVSIRVPVIRLVASLLLMLAQAVIYMVWNEAAWPFSLLLFAGVILLYAKELLGLASKLLRSALDFLKRGKK